MDPQTLFFFFLCEGPSPFRGLMPYLAIDPAHHILVDRKVVVCTAASTRVMKFSVRGRMWRVKCNWSHLHCEGDGHEFLLCTVLYTESFLCRVSVYCLGHLLQGLCLSVTHSLSLSLSLSLYIYIYIYTKACVGTLDNPWIDDVLVVTSVQWGCLG